MPGRRDDRRRLRSFSLIAPKLGHGTFSGTTLLVCEHCASVFDATSPQTARIMNEISQRAGLKLLAYSLRIFGRCQACHSGGRTAERVTAR